MPHLPDLEAWAIFAKVAEKGSFSRAAEELGLANTTVSKAISRLEQRMRTTLFHRTTRKLSLTESGRTALDRAARILSDGASIEADIIEEAAVPQGLVRIAVTTGFGTHALAPLLPQFFQAFPQVRIDLCLTEDRIDVVADGFDVVVQIGGGIDSSLRIRRLFSFRRPLVASPDFLRRHGVPEHPTDLVRYPAIIPTHVPWGSEWEFTKEGEEPCRIHLTDGFRVNNASAMVPWAVAGIGLALMPEYFIWRELEEGRLVKLLPDWSVPPGPICVVTPPGRAQPARVRVLLDFMREHFASPPWAQGIEK